MYVVQSVRVCEYIRVYVYGGVCGGVARHGHEPAKAEYVISHRTIFDIDDRRKAGAQQGTTNWMDRRHHPYEVDGEESRFYDW